MTLYYRTVRNNLGVALRDGYIKDERVRRRKSHELERGLYCKRNDGRHRRTTFNFIVRVYVCECSVQSTTRVR